MSTKNTKIRIPPVSIGMIIIAFIAIITSALLSSTQPAHAASELSPSAIKDYSLNNIYFFEPCKSGNSGNFSTICGSTPKEKYWSALRKEFDETHVAAMFGSIDHEGFFGPTLWEYKLVPPGSGQFAPGYSWNQLYNCFGSSCPGGIGVFQITWKLGPYLQNVDSKNPDLLQYFKDPKYSLDGDSALKTIGATDYDRLVQQEIDFVLDSVDKESFKATSTLDEATDWWTKYYENCANCCGSADADHSCEQIALRRASAHKEYDDMQGFTCNSSSTVTSSSDSSHASGSFSDNATTTDNITWIGDSYSVAANNKGLISEYFSNVDFGSGNPDTSTSYIQVNKFVSSGSNNNPSCLSILKETINSGKLRPNLVFACGTNGGWSASDIAEFKNLLTGKDTKVVVVNSKIPGNDYTDSNKLLKKLADDNDNIALADWAAVYNNAYFKSDSIHPNDDPGYEKWVTTIANALNSFGTDDSTSNSVCNPTNDNSARSDNNVIAAVEEIIDLANKNGSTYTWGGGHTTDVNVFNSMLSGAPINVDCTGFASLVMYKAFGKMTSFTSYSIFTDPLYEEVPRSDVRPGDVFAYNSPTGHGGIVVEASGGVVTKIAETGGPEGKSGGNTNIGYSNSNDFSVVNMNGSNGHFFRFKGAK